MKYYAEEDDEFVYPLSYFKEMIRDGKDPFVLNEMKRAVGKHTSYNGKSGKCWHLVARFSPTGKQILLSSTGVKRLYL